MTLPAFLFGLLVSTLYGAAFHVWRGGSFWRLVLYIFLGWAGFWAGHFLGNSMALEIGKVGPLQIGMGTLSSAIFLGVGYWLSLVKVEETH
jgi:hypothetical protein